MRQPMRVFCGVVAIAALAFTSGLAVAQTTSNGPYYATPSWDQSLACDSAAACPRFVVLSNLASAAVLDRETGLVWDRNPTLTPYIWVDAQDHCNTLVIGNRKGWRVPTIQDLASLMDPSAAAASGIAVPAGHPFGPNVGSHLYWSATTRASDTALAWIASFGGGDILSEFKHNGLFVWCVRGGQGVDPQ